jgi:hypothetical protein
VSTIKYGLTLWLIERHTDVVVPIPLPLSAILILVIGTQTPLGSFVGLADFTNPDLGFELFVAVRSHFVARTMSLSDNTRY